jgi:hypothetical protein
MTTYKEFHKRSIEDRDGFWKEQAELIDWNKAPEQICDYSRPPFVKWFKGGETNLCHNAVDRHAAQRPDANALIYISTETNEEKVYSFAELQREVERMAAIYQDLGVKKGDRVLIYMPMIAEAAFAMLACARIGAIHSVVFGGFASGSLATRIDDAKPVLMVSSDAGMRNGKAVPYKHLVDEACKIAEFPPKNVLIVDRGLDKGFPKVEGRDVDYAELRAKHMDATTGERVGRHIAIEIELVEHGLDPLVQPPGIGGLHCMLQPLQLGHRLIGGIGGHPMQGLVIALQYRSHVTQPVGHHIEHRTRQIEIGFLRHIGNANIRRPPHLAIIQRSLTDNRLEQTRLARAIAPDQRHPLTRIQLEIRVIEQGHMPKGKAGAID